MLNNLIKYFLPVLSACFFILFIYFIHLSDYGYSVMSISLSGGFLYSFFDGKNNNISLLFFILFLLGYFFKNFA